jgi:hypothetical protein
VAGLWQGGEIVTVYRPEIEALAAGMRRMAGWRATDAELLKCTELLKLPAIQTVLQQGPNQTLLLGALRDMLENGIRNIRRECAFPSINHIASAAQTREAIRILFGLNPNYADASHKKRREEAARALGTFGNVELWRRPDRGPELELMRILAASLYALSYQLPTTFYVDRLEDTSFFDEAGRLVRQDKLLEIRAAVDNLDVVKTFISYLDDPRPEVCHYEPLTGCSVRSIEPNNGNNGLVVTVQLEPPVKLGASHILTYRHTYTSEVIPTQDFDNNRLDAVDNYGVVVLRSVFDERRKPAQVGWYSRPRQHGRVLYPEPGYLLEPVGPLTYAKDFGVVRQGWVYGLCWRW